MSGNKRNHPQFRAQTAQNLILQARDVETVLGVYKYRQLSRKQIQTLFGFGSITRVNSRLRKLFDAKYLDRIFVSAFWGSPEAYYYLGIKGIALVAEKTNEDILEIKKKRTHALKTKELFLKHLIAVNEVRIAFELAMKKSPDFRLLFYSGNIQLIGGQSNILKPDGYLAFAYKEKVYALFLEIDLCTESLKRIQQKVETYLNFGLSGEYERQFKHKYFKVLFIAPSAIRLQNIKKVIEKITDKMFWFAETDKVSPDTVFSNIWQRPKKEGLFSLIQAGDGK